MDQFKDFLVRTQKLDIYTCPEFKLFSKPEEDLLSFKVKLINLLKEEKEKEIEQLREDYQKKEEKLQDRYDSLSKKLEKEQTDSQTATTQSILSMGASILGVFLGRTRIGTLDSGMTSNSTAKENGYYQFKGCSALGSVGYLYPKDDSSNHLFSAYFSSIRSIRSQNI